MTVFEHVRYWIAKPLLERMRQELTELTIRRQQEAYVLGRAHGETLGQTHMLSELVRVMEERGGEWPEFTPGDLERAKKGLVH